MEKGFREDRKKTFFALIFKKKSWVLLEQRIRGFCLLKTGVTFATLSLSEKFASLKHSLACVQVYALLKHTHQN